MIVASFKTEQSIPGKRNVRQEMSTLTSSTLHSPSVVSSCRTQASRHGLVAVCCRNAFEILKTDPVLGSQIQHVTLHCKGRDLVLGGQLPSFYLKQLTQESLRGFSAANGLRIRNGIVVAKST